MPHSLDATARILLLYEVTALRTDAVEKRIDTALKLVTQALSLEIGILSQIDDQIYTIRQVYAPGAPLQPGQAFALGQTYCQLTLQATEVISISHAEKSPHAFHPCRSGFGLESYIGAVVIVRGERVGTLNFSSATPRAVAFTNDDEVLVAMLARWVGVALEAQLAEAERAESEARFQGAFDSAGIGMAIVAPDGRLIEVNESFCSMLGYRAAELQEMGFQQITYPDDLAADVQKVNEMLAGTLPAYQTEKRYLHRSGRIVWGHLSVSAVRHSDGKVKYFVSQIQDITARKESEEQLRQMVYHDALTGLYNRRYFLEQIPGQLAFAKQKRQGSALLYLDLNGFKAINDTFGHQVGDELLKSVARRFRKGLRESDILARLGGDEFAVFLPNINSVDAERVAQRLADSLEQSFSLSGTVCQVGVSIGVVLVSDQTDIEALLKQVDTTMYRAKERKQHDPRAVEIVGAGISPLFN